MSIGPVSVRPGMRFPLIAGLVSVVCLAMGVVRGTDVMPSTPASFDAAYAAIIASAGKESDALRLRRLFDLDWHYTMTESPESATYNGYPGQNHRWSDLSSEAIARRKSEMARPRQALESIDRRGLGREDQLSYDLFRRDLEVEREGLQFPSEYLLVNQMGGIQRAMPDTLAMMPMGTRADVESLLKRLESADVLVRQTVALLREGAARGVVPPRVPLRDLPQQVLNLLTEDPRSSALFRPVEKIPKSVLSGDERAAVEKRAVDALSGRLYPAFREMHAFLEKEYLPRCRENVACSALPNGRAWYAFNTRVRTTTSLSPREIHEIGLSEVRRIRREMERVIATTGFTGTFSEFLSHLRTDPKFYYERGTELIAGYRDIAKRADGELPKLFGRLPRTPYAVQPVPSYSERSQTTAYYQPGSMVAGRPGIYFANTYSIGSRPKWEMEALSLHESVPGHHLQIALSQELEGVPEFRKHAETTAFVEGWGLYSESLGEAMGFYQDPYSKFGQLTYEMWRAIRLVVDTGMHELGWTREQAIQFFKDNAGKTEHDITVEVDRYIVWPGQALAYKIGELKIQELRRLAEKELGDRFDIRAFHDELLSRGALPLDVLEPLMRAWITTRKTAG